MKNFVEEQEELQFENPTTSVNVTQTSTQKSAKTKSNRFEKYQDVVMVDMESVGHMSEVDHYLDDKFNLQKYKDEAGEKLLMVNDKKFCLLVVNSRILSLFSKFPAFEILAR